MWVVLTSAWGLGRFTLAYWLYIVWCRLSIINTSPRFYKFKIEWCREKNSPHDMTDWGPCCWTLPNLEIIWTAWDCRLGQNHACLMTNHLWMTFFKNICNKPWSGMNHQYIFKVLLNFKETDKFEIEWCREKNIPHDMPGWGPCHWTLPYLEIIQTSWGCILARPKQA